MVLAYGAALLAVSLAAVVMSSILAALRRSRRLRLHFAATVTNEAILQGCPSLQQVYRSAWFLPNGHFETAFAWAFRSNPRVRYYRRCVPLEDGSTVTLDFEDPPQSQVLPADAPVLIILPGLTGGSHDSYPQHAAAAARKRGFRPVVFNPCGTSNGPMTAPRFCSASHTDDFRAAVDFLHALYPDAPLMAAGYSLGANVLVRYLGEQGLSTPLQAAVSLCSPFDLAKCNKRLTEGLSNVYRYILGAGLRRAFAPHISLFRGHEGKGWDLDLAQRARTVKQFDIAITVPCFGWGSVEEYYQKSGAALAVPEVAVPLLCIQAADDPIAPEEAIPYDALQQNPNCILAVTSHGGHLGWVRPHAPFAGPWTDAPMLEFLEAVLTRTGTQTLQEVSEQTTRKRRSPRLAAATNGDATQWSMAA